MNRFTRSSTVLGGLGCLLVLACSSGCTSGAAGGEGAPGDVTTADLPGTDVVTVDTSPEVVVDTSPEDVVDASPEDVGADPDTDTGGVCSEEADECDSWVVPVGGCVDAFECDPDFTDDEGSHCRPVFKANGSPCLGGPDGEQAQVIAASAVATDSEVSTCDRFVCHSEADGAPECALASTLPVTVQLAMELEGHFVKHECALEDMPSDVSGECNDWICGCATDDCLEAQCKVKPDDGMLGQACAGADACFTGTCYVVPGAPYTCVQSPVLCPAVSDASCVVMPGCDAATGGCSDAMDETQSNGACDNSDPCLASALCDPDHPEADAITGCVLVYEDPESACGDAIVSISAGGGHTLALQADGLLWGWGTKAYSEPPEGVLFKQVSAGKSHSCGVDLEGSVHCWGIQDGGNWDFGQVTLTPTEGSYTHVAAGWNHSCAVKDDGGVVCWGIGSEDNLTAEQEPYEKGQVTGAPTEAAFQAVGAGHSHTCGLKNDGSVECWGGGSGVVDVPTDTHFVSLAIGLHHGCALGTEGEITCWGWTKFGLIEDVPDGAFQSVSCGYGHSCAVRTTGEVVCWGVPNKSEGAPQVTDTGQVTDAPDGPGFKLVGVNSTHSCAVTTDDKVTCWGSAGSSKSTPPVELQP